MKTRILFAAILCLFISGVSSNGQVPQLINYQGRVAVGGTNFDGTGQFKFALVNADGGTTYWSNDGTSTAGSQPVDAVSLPVGKGIYAVLLGDATIPHMTVVPATVFTNNDVRLRVWFNDGTHDWQQLTPDQRIAAVGYAMMAGNVPDGAITTAKIAAGAVGAAQISNGAVGSDQLAAGSVSAALSVSGDLQTAATNASYVVTGTTATAFTLPSTANLGDTVEITGANAGWSVLPFAWSNQLPVNAWGRWTSITSSSDGTKLAACAVGEQTDQIYTSADSGVTWTALTTNLGWISAIASSADGTKLAACVIDGRIFTSTDSGTTWTARASTQQWYSIASSADGTKLAACVNGGQIYTSADSGDTWITRASTQQWYSITSSADGTKLAACDYMFGYIYTAEAYSGPQGTTGSFRYVGNGNWARVVEAP